MSRSRIILGDAFQKIDELENGSVDCVVTSPPYFNLRDYQVSDQLGREETVFDYIENLKKIFEKIKRVLKQTGTLFVNIGETYPPSSKTAAGVPELFLIMMRYELEFLVRNKIIWQKRNGFPKTGPDRFSLSYENVYFFSKSKSYYFYRLFEPFSENSKGNMGKPYTGKAQKEYLEYGAEDPSEAKRSIIESMKKNPGRTVRDVWSINTKPHPFHTSTFPPELVKRCLESGCPPYVCSKCGEPAFPVFEPSEEYKKLLGKSWTPDQDASRGTREIMGMSRTRNKKSCVVSDYHLSGWKKCNCGSAFVPGLVLDPFAGGFTTAIVAKELCLDYIMVEINKEFCVKGLDLLRKTGKLNPIAPLL